MKHEGQYRKQMIEIAKQKGANWAVIIDPDERFERYAGKILNRLIAKHHGQKVMFQLNFKELYRPDAYRSDGIWDTKIRIPVFPLRDDNIFTDARLQAPKQPLNQDYEIINTGLNIYHMKHITPELIQHRRDLYTKLDPDWQFNAIGYDYLIDETGIQLTAIESGREYLPPYRDYQIDEAIFDNV